MFIYESVLGFTIIDPVIIGICILPARMCLSTTTHPVQCLHRSMWNVVGRVRLEMRNIESEVPRLGVTGGLFPTKAPCPARECDYLGINNLGAPLQSVSRLQPAAAL